MELDVHAQQRVVAGERAVEETTYANKFMVCNQAGVSYLEGQRMTPEDEEFNRVEMESRIKQDYVRDMKQPSREQLMAEVAVLTELVRVLSDRVAELEKNNAS